jgi:hypothetical protein
MLVGVVDRELLLESQGIRYTVGCTNVSGCFQSVGCGFARNNGTAFDII